MSAFCYGFRLVKPAQLVHCCCRRNAGRFYTGMVTVTAEVQPRWTVKVQLYGFDIPRKNTLEVDCWFYLNYGWSSFYGGIAYNPELHAKHAEVLGRYRMSSFPEDWTFLCSQVLITETDGKFTFDWSRFDQSCRTRNGIIQQRFGRR